MKRCILLTLAGALIIISGCGPIRVPDRFNPTWCDSHPADCRLCQPGNDWVPGVGCRPRPEPTPTAPTPAPTPTPVPEPTATPTIVPTSVPPTSTPTVPPRPPVHPPTLFRQKVQNIDRPSDRNNPGCVNSLEGPKFLNDYLCEVGSTPLFEANAATGPGPSGPCDPGHAATFNSICGRQEWNVPPHYEIRDGGHTTGDRCPDNPHHICVTFTPGRCFTVCTWAEKGDKTGDGIEVPIGENTRTCALHCY